MAVTKSFRIIGGPAANPPTTDFFDIEGLTIVIATSGAYTNGNVLKQGEPVCWDGTSLVTNNVTTPVCENVCLPVNSTSAAGLAGVYQGNTFTNASTSAVLTTTITLRKQGYGVVNAGGVTTTITIGGILTILPGSTPTYASQLIGPGTAAAPIYYVGTSMATAIAGAQTTIGGLLVTASTTTQQVVNAYINVNG